MASLIPSARGFVNYIPLRDGFLLTPPVWWWSVAADWNVEPTGLQDGRYYAPRGHVEGYAVPTMQDTFLSGTGSRTGRAFSAALGTWKDDWVSPYSNRYGLLMPDGSSGAQFDAIEAAPYSTNGMKRSLIRLRRGIAPADAAHTSANCYAYLEFNYGSTVGALRLAMRWSDPISLEYQGSDGLWSTIAICKELGNLGNYLEHHDNLLTLHVAPDRQKGVFNVDVGNGNFLHFAAPRPSAASSLNAPGALPSLDRLRLYGQNGWVSMEVYPYTHKAPVVQKSPKQFGPDKLANVGNSQAIVNMLGSTPPGQATNGTVVHDGAGNLEWTAYPTSPDPAEPARLSDVLVYIPPVWASVAFGPPIPDSDLPIKQVHQVETWDDANRIGTRSAMLIVDNHRFQYSQSLGNYAIDLIGSNSVGSAQQLRGVLGSGPDGISTYRQDPIRLAMMPCRDFFVKMEQPICYEVVFDGFCIFRAVELLCEMGNIAPIYLGYIPKVGNPPYPDNFPYYILASGTGMNPKYRFTPERSVLSCLLEIIQESGSPDPYTGAVAPHFMFFDSYGNFHFEPYLPALGVAQYGASKFYWSVDPTGLGQIEDIRYFNSVDQMLTEVIVQGQDALTYELIQANVSLPLNYFTVGYRKAGIARSARYGTGAYVQKIADLSAKLASLPVRVARFNTTFDPNVRAGDVVGVDGELMTVMEISSVYGVRDPYNPDDGYQTCRSTLTARALINSVAF